MNPGPPLVIAVGDPAVPTKAIWHGTRHARPEPAIDQPPALFLVHHLYMH